MVCGKEGGSGDIECDERARERVERWDSLVVGS